METAFDDSGRATFLAMGVGVGVGLAIVVIAVFQEMFARAARRVGRAIVNRSRAPAPHRFADGATSFLIRLRRAPARVFESARRILGRLTRRPIRASRDQPEDDAQLTIDEQLARGAFSDDGTATDPERVDDAVVEVTRRGPLLRRQFHVPVSTIHIEEELRAFLNARDGVAPFESIVRHFDRTFGPGRGRGIIETQRARGAIVLVRDPDRPTRIVAVLKARDDGDASPV